LVKAFFVKHALQLSAILKSGEQVTFSSEQAPIEERKSSGKAVVAVAKTDQIVVVLKRGVVS
jgi:topoisomerase-4 subunit A